MVRVVLEKTRICVCSERANKKKRKREGEKNREEVREIER